MKRFRSDLDKVYGERLERVVLFGSRARGDAQPDSDYDVAVFIKDYSDFAKEVDTLADIELYIMYDTNAVINSLPYAAGSYRKSSPLMYELQREGVDL